MRILVFGGKGMLGHKLVQDLGKKFEVWTTIRGQFREVEHFGIFELERTVENIDVKNPQSVRRSIATSEPDVVINAVGVIKQVPASQDAVQTLSINSIFPRRLAALAAEYGFRLITISTDCVFSGDAGSYTEVDVPDPRDLYGISKLLGEVDGNKCLTLRTSIIGRELGTGHSIVEWFLSNRGSRVRGYTKAIYTGFSTIELSGIISTIITERRELTGVYHVSSEPINKFELLQLLNKYYDAGTTIEPFGDYVVDKSLDSSRFRTVSGFMPANWETMIEQMAADPTPYDKWNR